MSRDVQGKHGGLSGSATRLPLLLGLGMALSYGIFSVLAATFFPRPYAPWENETLSQLGNSLLNPNGYILYLIGCALSGLFAIAFFVSLGSWRRSGTAGRNRLLTLVQALGVAGGFGLFMNAVFPETSVALHHFWAGVVFNCLGAAMLLAPFAMWRPGGPNLVLAIFTVLSGAAVLVMFIFARVHWVEWLPVGLFLLCPPLVGILTSLSFGNAATSVREGAVEGADGIRRRRA